MIRKQSIPNAETIALAQEGKRLFDSLQQGFEKPFTTAEEWIYFFDRLTKKMSAFQKEIETKTEQITMLESELAQARKRTASTIRQAKPQQQLMQQHLSLTIIESLRQLSSIQQRLHYETDFDDFAEEISWQDMIKGLNTLSAAIDPIATEVVNDDFLQQQLLQQRWLHYLLRAEALCRTYYPTENTWFDLQITLSMLTNTLRRYLKTMHYTLPLVTLLKPINKTNSCIVSSHQSDVKSLKPVQRALKNSRLHLMSNQPLVIDCVQFSLSDEQLSNVIVYNPADWL